MTITRIIIRNKTTTDRVTVTAVTNSRKRDTIFSEKLNIGVRVISQRRLLVRGLFLYRMTAFHQSRIRHGDYVVPARRYYF